MKLADINSWIQETTLRQHISWCDLEVEIATLRNRLAALTSGRDSIFLRALRCSDDAGASAIEISLVDLCDARKNQVMDDLASLECEMLEITQAEGVITIEDGLDGPCHIISMDMILDDDAKAAFYQAGADVSISFEPEKSMLDRIMIIVRPMVERGYDFSAFDHPVSGFSVKRAPGPNLGPRLFTAPA